MSKNNFFLFLLVIIPSAYATECYQEFANATTCGQSIVGLYENTRAETVDGNWGTYGAEGSGENSYINYTIPTYFLYANISFAWHDEASGWHYENLSIPLEYLDNILQIYYSYTGADFTLQLYNYTSSSFQTFYYQSGEEDAYTILAEEGIFWEIGEIPAPSPSPEQESIFYTSLASSGTGLGIFLDAIKMPLANVLLGLGIVVSVILIIYVFIFHLRTLIKPKPLR